MAVKELSDGGADGTRLGQDTSDLVAFHGSTPTDQYANIVSVGTSAPFITSSYGFTSTQASALITAVNSIIALLEEKGLASDT